MCESHRRRRGSGKVRSLWGLVLVLAFWACSATPVIEVTGLEASLVTGLRADGVPAQTATCPEGLAPVSGQVVSCAVELTAGGSVATVVEMTDDRGGYRYHLAPGQVADGPAVAQAIAGDLAVSGPPAPRVDCPASTLAPGARATVECVVRGVSDVPIRVTIQPGEPPQWSPRTS